MTRLRKLLFLQTIYFKQTPRTITTVYGCIFLLVLLSVLFVPFDYAADFVLPYIIIGAIFCYFLLRTIIRTSIVAQAIAKTPRTPVYEKMSRPDAPSISLELDGIDSIRELSRDNNIRIYRASFNFYQETKTSRYLSKQAYYTVFEARLDRVLPSLLFDSKQAKGRQFKYIYSGVQRISVQAAFDDYFVTYTPVTYNIDSLSFITPEVMEKLIDARAYDIEIAEDKLLLYASLISTDDVATLTDHGTKIMTEINDNINNYRDDRLTGQARVTSVTPFGRTLLESPFRYIPTAVAFGVISIAIIYFATVNPDPAKVLLNTVSLTIFGGFILNVIVVINIAQTNRKAIQQIKR